MRHPSLCKYRLIVYKERETVTAVMYWSMSITCMTTTTWLANRFGRIVRVSNV